MIGAVTPLLALPAISHRFGVEGWSAIAVGQSVGAAASVAVELGWGLTGPQAVASTDHWGSSRLLASSMKSRVAVAVAVLPAAALVVWLLAPPYVFAAVLAAAAMSISGLSLNWFFIGLGRPSRIFWSDALPRLLSVLLGVASITLLAAPLEVFSACLLLGFLASPVVGVALARPSRLAFSNVDDVVATVRRQAVALVGRGLSAVYIGLPVALVQAWAPTAVPVFAAAERLMRMGLLVLQSVPNVLQRTIGVATNNANSLKAVSRQVIALQAIVGAIAGTVCALAMPRAVDLLFAGEAKVGFDLSTAAGCVVVLTSLSRATGMLLVARRRVRWITMSAGAAALSAFWLLTVLPGRFGATGAMLALVAAELVALAIQVFGLTRWAAHNGGRP